MGVAIIIALVVVVVTLLWLSISQGKTIEKYEDELIKNSKKGKK